MAKAGGKGGASRGDANAVLFEGRNDRRLVDRERELRGKTTPSRTLRFSQSSYRKGPLVGFRVFRVYAYKTKLGISKT